MTDPILGMGELLGSLFGNVFGLPIIAGLMGLILLIVLGVALKFSLEMFIFLLIPALFILSISGLLPSGVMWGIGFLGALIIFFAVFKIFRR